MFSINLKGYKPGFGGGYPGYGGGYGGYGGYSGLGLY